MSNTDTSFAEVELTQAKEAFANWQLSSNESIDEYTLRKRKAELYALVRTVIRNELDEGQQEFVRLYWYEGKTLSEISKIMQLDKSTLSRREKKINNIIYEKLKYAMEYRYGKSFDKTAKLVIKSRSPVCCPVEAGRISQRLRNLRLNQSLSTQELAHTSGINKSRIEQLEKSGSLATAKELSILCRLYGTTADYIIFGNDKERTDL